MNYEFQITDASTKDAHDIGQIQIQTWLTNYPNPSTGITREDIEEKTKQWNKAGDERIKSQIQNPNAHTWVAKYDNKVVGFISVLKKDNESSIEAIHILPEFQGKGIGTKLLTKALNWIGNDKKVTLEVVSYNDGAQRLYKKLGFKEQGEATDDIITLPNGKTIPKILMVKD